MISVPIPKFAQACRLLGRELRNQRDTGKFIIVVPLSNLKFFIELAAHSEELQIRGTNVPIPKFAQACGFTRKNLKFAALDR